ncbi:hypothetical protein [Saccharobesus litoralis]|nr:hypothetical protein [Saccharobesus litoralis]
MAESQLKRVQALLKEGTQTKWGRDLVTYQSELFEQVDLHCYPQTGVNAHNKTRKVIRKGSQDKHLLTSRPQVKKNLASIKKHELQEHQIAEIGPARKLERILKKSKTSKKSKAWQAWYSAPPECKGKLDMDMFVWCNKVERANKAKFDKLWDKRSQ